MRSYSLKAVIFQDAENNYMIKKTKEIDRFLSYISLMTVNLDKTGLKSIINDIDLLFIDIWGVLHNGIKLYKESINVLDKLEQSKKEYILLTNAPRPNSTVINFLMNMGLDKIIFKLIGGLKSSMGYLGSKKVSNLRNKPKFVKITKAGFYESMVHNIDEIKKDEKY